MTLERITLESKRVISPVSVPGSTVQPNALLYYLTKKDSK